MRGAGKGPSYPIVLLVPAVLISGWLFLTRFQPNEGRNQGTTSGKTQVPEPSNAQQTESRAVDPSPDAGAIRASATSTASGLPEQGPSVTPQTDVVTGVSAESRSFMDYLNQGNQELEQGRLESALGLYLQALEMEKEDEDVYFNLGVVMGRLGKVDESISCYKKALEIFPDYAEAYNNLGNQYVVKGNLDQASEAFTSALEVFPDYAIAENNLGNALGRQGKTMEAGEHFLRAVELDPSYVEARYNLGNAYALQNLFDLAREQFDSILQTDPGFAHAERALKALDKVQVDQSPKEP